MINEKHSDIDQPPYGSVTGGSAESLNQYGSCGVYGASGGISSSFDNRGGVGVGAPGSRHEQQYRNLLTAAQLGWSNK